MLITSSCDVNRLKRIQEVREQERSISRQQVSRYRSELNESKNRRLQQSKEDKLIQLERTQQELIIEWQRALLENGKAHTISEREQKTERTFRSSVDENIRFQRALKKEREKREKDSQRTESMKKMKIEVTRDFHKNAREEARAYAEKVNSSMKNRTERKIESPIKKENFRIHVTEETIVNRNRKNVPVKATIIRHFDALAHDDIIMVKNDASVATQEIYRRLWGKVMQELLNKRTTRLRGRRASQQMLSISNSPAGVANLERHLHMLEMLDKQHRGKLSPSQGGTNRLRVSKQKVAESIEMNFEEQFLKSSRQWTIESNNDYLPRPFVVHGLISDLDSAAVVSTASVFEDAYQSSLRDYDDWRNPNPVRSNHNRLINVNDFPSQQFIPWRNAPSHLDNTTSLLLSPSSPSTSEEELSSGRSSTRTAVAMAAVVPLSRATVAEEDDDDERPTVLSALPESPAEVDSRLRETDGIRTVNVPTVKADTSFASVLSDEIQVDRSAHPLSSDVATRNVISDQRKPNAMKVAPPSRAGASLNEMDATARYSHWLNEETSEFDQGFSTASNQIASRALHRDDNLTEDYHLRQQMEMLRSKSGPQDMRASGTNTQQVEKPYVQPPQAPPIEQVRQSLETAHDAIPRSRIQKKDCLDNNVSSNFKVTKRNDSKQHQERDSNQGHNGTDEKGRTPTSKGKDKLADTTLPQEYRSVPGNSSSRGVRKERDTAADAAAEAAAHAFSTSLGSNGARREHRPQKRSDGKSDKADTWPHIPSLPSKKRDESEVVHEDKSEDLDLSVTFQSSSSGNLSADGYDRYFNDAIQSVRHSAIVEAPITNKNISDSTSFNHAPVLPNRSPSKSVIERGNKGNRHPQGEVVESLHGNGSGISLTVMSRRQSQNDHSNRDPSAEAVAAAHAFSLSMGDRDRNTQDGKQLPSENRPLLNGSEGAVSMLYNKKNDSKRAVSLSTISKENDDDLDLSGVSQSSSSISSSSSNLSVHGYDKYFNDTIQSISRSATAGTTHTVRKNSSSSYPHQEQSVPKHSSYKSAIEKEISESKKSQNRTNETLRSSTDHFDDSGVSLTVTSRRHTRRETAGRDPSAEAVAVAHAFSQSKSEGARRERHGEGGTLILPDNHRPLHRDSDVAAAQLYGKRDDSEGEVSRSAIATGNDGGLDLSGVSQRTNFNSGGYDRDLNSAAVNQSTTAIPNLSSDKRIIEEGREKSVSRNPRRGTIGTTVGSTDTADRSGVFLTVTSTRDTSGTTRGRDPSAEAVAAAHAFSMSLDDNGHPARRSKDEGVTLEDGVSRRFPSPDKHPVRSIDGSVELDLSATFHDSSSDGSSNLSIESYNRYLKDAVQSIQNRANRSDAMRIGNHDHAITQSEKANSRAFEDREVSAVKVHPSKQFKGQPLSGMDTSTTPDTSVIETLNSAITTMALQNKYDTDRKNPLPADESSIVVPREGNKSNVLTMDEEHRNELAYSSPSSSSLNKSSRHRPETNQSVDSIVSSTSGSVSSDSIATDRLLQQWEDLFATRVSPKQNPEREKSKILVTDSPKTVIDRHIDPPISTHSSFSSGGGKDIKLVLNNESEYNNWSVSRSGFVHKYSEEPENNASESASKSLSEDIFSGSKDSDSTAELLRQWNDLYSTSRVSDRRDVVLTDDHRLLSMESTVFNSLKELQPPNPPAIPIPTVDDDTFNHSLHSESIKQTLSSSWNSSLDEIMGSDFLLETDNAQKNQDKVMADRALTEPSKQASLQYSDDSSRNFASQIGVRDSSGSFSSSTAAAESNLYEQWNTLYSSRMSNSAVNNAPILDSTKASDTFRNDYLPNTVSSDILFGDSSREYLRRKEEEADIPNQKAAEVTSLSPHRSPASGSLWEISDSSKDAVSVSATTSKMSSDILSPVKIEGTPAPVAQNLSDVENSSFSFLGSKSNVLLSAVPAADDRQSSDQSNVTDDVSITDLLKRWQDRRASSETLVDIPGRQYGVNNIIAREEEGIFSAIRADKTRPPVPRFNDSLFSSTVDNEDDYHLDDLSLSVTLQLSSSKLQGYTTPQVYNSPSQIDSKSVSMSKEGDALPIRFAATSDNVSLRTFRSTKIETANSNSLSPDVNSISTGSDSDTASSSGMAMSTLFDASLVNTLDVDRAHTKNMSTHPDSATLNDLLAGYTSHASIADLNSSFSLSNALSRLPLHLQDLQDRMNASQSSLVVPSDLSSDFSDEPTPAFQIDLGESSDSLSASFKAGADATQTSLRSTSSSSVDMGIRWEALGTIGTAHRTEKSTDSSIDLSSRNKKFDVDAAEIHHAILDMRGKLLSTLAATETPIQHNSISIDRSVNMSSEMEGWSVSKLAERDGNVEDAEQHAASVQFRSYQSFPTTSRRSENATFIDGASAIHPAFESVDYDVLLGLQGSKTSEPNSSDSDVEPLIRSLYPSSPLQANASTEDLAQTFAPVSYMHRFVSGPKSSAANPTPNLSVRRVSNDEAPSSESESDSRRSRGTTSMSLSGSISNVSTYPLRGSASPSLHAQLRHRNPHSPTTDIVADFSVSSDRGVAEDEAVPIDSIHSDDGEEEFVGYLTRSVRM